MTRREVADQILNLLEPVGIAETELLQAQALAVGARERLADREAALLLEVVDEECPDCLHLTGQPQPDCKTCRGGGTIATATLNGRNETARAAQLRQLTVTERAGVVEADLWVASRRVNLAVMRDQLGAWKSVARLLGADAD